MRRLWLLGAVVLMAGCGSSVNVEEERTNLLALDREWSQNVKDTEKYVSYFAPDASTYPQGMPLVSGTAAIREMAAQMAKTASTFQVHGMGPFAVNYVNPADDPSKQPR